MTRREAPPLRTEARAAAQPAYHLCAAVPGETLREDAAVAFLLRGLRREQRLVHVCQPDDRRRFIARLERAGGDPQRLVGEGRLVVLAVGDVYYSDGTFEPERALEVLSVADTQATAEGHRGLRVTADMSWAPWAAGTGAGWERLVRYERDANARLSSGNSAVLCAYDPSSVPPVELRRLLDAHALVQHPPPARPARGLRRGGGEAAALALAGEIDLGTTGHLQVAVREHQPPGRDFHVDLHDLRFIDVGALRVLLRTAAASLGGAKLVLHDPPPVTRRTLTVLGWDRLSWVRVVRGWPGDAGVAGDEAGGGPGPTPWSADNGQRQP